MEGRTAIHTNAGQLGIWANVGQVDFYINGGTGPQPGCLQFDSLKSSLKSVTGSVSGSCSHDSAYKFFSQTILDGTNVRSATDLEICSCSSLTSYKLGLCKCETKVVFGEYARAG